MNKPLTYNIQLESNRTEYVEYLNRQLVELRAYFDDEQKLLEKVGLFPNKPAETLKLKADKIKEYHDKLAQILWREYKKEIVSVERHGTGKLIHNLSLWGSYLMEDEEMNSVPVIKEFVILDFLDYLYNTMQDDETLVITLTGLMQ